MQKLFHDFFRINLGHVASAAIFLCGIVWGQAKVEERIALLDQRDTAQQREALGLITATRTERGIQLEEIRRRIEATESRQVATDALLSEVRTLNARLGALDQRISELREDFRRR